MKRLTTSGGFARLEERHRNVKKEYYAVCADNEAAAESGDSSVWHDNFAYEENQRQMHQLAKRIVELEKILRDISIVPKPMFIPNTTQIGVCVHVVQISTQQEMVFYLSGYQDGNVQEGRLSYLSPMGSAFLDLEIGESTEVMHNNTQDIFELIAISLPTSIHHN